MKKPIIFAMALLFAVPAFSKSLRLVEKVAGKDSFSILKIERTESGENYYTFAEGSLEKYRGANADYDFKRIGNRAYSDREVKSIKINTRSRQVLANLLSATVSVGAGGAFVVANRGLFAKSASGGDIAALFENLVGMFTNLAGAAGAVVTALAAGTVSNLALYQDLTISGEVIQALNGESEASGLKEVAAYLDSSLKKLDQSNNLMELELGLNQ